MQLPPMTKFGFRIRTASGLSVDNLLIQSQDEAGAEKKLRQMYPYCTVVECICHSPTLRASSSSFEDVLGLITR
ncbi:MAG: hypothetical protein Q8O31_05405 [Rhodocyclaceae bacterium]|nr:hypothetical protein [Rhodocyclaceae bacterium]